MLFTPVYMATRDSPSKIDTIQYADKQETYNIYNLYPNGIILANFKVQIGNVLKDCRWQIGGQQPGGCLASRCYVGLQAGA